MTSDRLFTAYLERQCADGMALAAASDVLKLAPCDKGLPPQRYVATFRCNGLVLQNKRIQTANIFMCEIQFPPNYLRAVHPFEVLTWLGPRNVFHPNISDRAPLICIGRLTPGTPLVDLLYQIFEIITYNKCTVSEGNCLNRVAAQWARRHQHLFPVDTRGLKRRTENTHVVRSTDFSRNPHAGRNPEPTKVGTTNDPLKRSLP